MFGAAADSVEPVVEVEANEKSAKLFQACVLPAINACASLRDDIPSIKEFLEVEFQRIANNHTDGQMCMEDIMQSNHHHTMGTMATVLFMEFVRNKYRRRNNKREPVMREEVDLYIARKTNALKWEFHEIIEKAVERGC